MRKNTNKGSIWSDTVNFVIVERIVLCMSAVAMPEFQNFENLVPFSAAKKHFFQIILTMIYSFLFFCGDRDTPSPVTQTLKLLKFYHFVPLSTATKMLWFHSNRHYFQNFEYVFVLIFSRFCEHFVYSYCNINLCQKEVIQEFSNNLALLCKQCNLKTVTDIIVLSSQRISKRYYDANYQKQNNLFIDHEIFHKKVRECTIISVMVFKLLVISADILPLFTQSSDCIQNGIK